MGGLRARFLAVMLIAFVAISAQCVAACAAESALPAKPSCHQPTDDSCSHDKTGDSAVKLAPIAPAVVIVAAAETFEFAPVAMLAPESVPLALTHEIVASTVLRI